MGHGLEISMELIDLYDVNRVRTGRTAERGSPIGPGEHCLVTHLCLFNNCGEMLVQHRSLSKDRYPGCWDVTAGGFVQSGEETADAAIREAWEELGLCIEKAELRFILTEPFSYVFDDFFFVRRQLDPSALALHSSELSAAAFASERDVLDMLHCGEFVDYSPELLRRIFAFERAEREERKS